MQIDIQNIDVIRFEGDGIVVPGNINGTMETGLAARIKDIVGPQVEAHVCEHAPIAIGASLVTEASNLPMRYLIHAPLLEVDGLRVGVENIRRATRASLLAATAFSMERIAIPAVGFGEEGVSMEEAARAMIDEIKGYKATHPSLVTITTEDAEMLDALRTQTRGG